MHAKHYYNPCFDDDVLLLQVVALETAGSGVTCNAVSPGFVDTPSMIPLCVKTLLHQ